MELENQIDMHNILIAFINIKPVVADRFIATTTTTGKLLSFMTRFN